MLWCVRPYPPVTVIKKETMGDAYSFPKTVDAADKRENKKV